MLHHRRWDVRGLHDVKAKIDNCKGKRCPSYKIDCEQNLLICFVFSCENNQQNINNYRIKQRDISVIPLKLVWNGLPSDPSALNPYSLS